MAALIDACRNPQFPAEVALVLSNRPDAAGLTTAREANIPTKVIEHGDYENREAFDAAMTDILAASGVRLICLAGFMRLLSAEFCQRWWDKIINIHPSLLPAFKGLDTHARAIEAGVRFAGCTVHYVRPAMDAGPIIIQAAVPIHMDDTPSSLAARVLAEEHKIYPQALRLIAEGRTSIDGGKVVIDDVDNAPSALINPFG